MESLQWFCLGILTMICIQGMVYASMVIKLKWYTIPLLIFGVLWVFFGIAWAGSSYLEGYPQSGSMALVFFSGFGTIFTIFVWRKLVMPDLVNKGQAE